MGNPAVDVEADVPPGENALRPLRAEQPFADKKPEHLPDDRPEIAVFPLEPGLVSSDERASLGAG